MRRLRNLCLVLVLIPGVGRADGLTPSALQKLLSAASTPNILQNANLAGGNATAATVLTNGATTAQTLSAKLGEHVSVADFGAVGGAVTYFLASAANVGDRSITLAGTTSIKLGEIVDGNGVTTGTTVAAVTYTAATGNTIVTLSSPLSAASPAGQRYDFAIQDDAPAFLRAQASGARYIEVPAGTTREYYLSTYVGNIPGLVWKLDGAYFAQNGGIVEAVNQALSQTMNEEALFNSMQQPGGEDTLLVTAANQLTNSTQSYQKNVVHVQLNQGDTSFYNFLGDPQTAVHDLVGYSVQGHCPTGNLKCSMFGSEALMTMDPSSDGTITGYEIAISNLSGAAAPEIGSWNNKSAMTLISNGSPMSAAMWVSGVAWQTGIDLSSSILGKAWAVRTEGPRNASGIATTHSDYAYVDHAGNLFAQTAHVVGGTTTGDIDPVGGVTIASDVAGRVAIGNAMAASGLQPSLEFHGGAGAATDGYTSRLVQLPAGLQVQPSGGLATVTFAPDRSTRLGGFLVYTQATLSAAATATTLSSHFNTVSACPSGSAVMLPSGLPTGVDLYVLNRCGAGFTVSPPAGASIESNAVGAGITIAAGATQHYYLESAAEWRQLQ